MKTPLLFVFCFLPFFSQACSCAWYTGFCETTTSNSIISTVKIIDKFDRANFKHFLKVELVENLRGNAPVDTMIIFASWITSCDPSPEVFSIGDTMIVNVTSKSEFVDEPHDFVFENACSQPFLFVKNGLVSRTQFHEPITESYEKFSAKIEDCAKLTSIDDPNMLEKLTEIHPNPAIEILNIRVLLAGEFQYEIYNTAGQKLAEEQIFGFEKRLNVSTFQSGVYFVKIMVNEVFIIKKIVKI